MRSVFITGAAGFIGGYAVREFVEQGWHVLALVHKRTSRELEALARKGDVTLMRGDLTDPAALQTALAAALERRGAKLDAIVHCAGRASDVGRRGAFRRANYESVKHMTALTRQLGAGRLVFVSTTDVYGLRDFHGETEDDLPLRMTLRNPYPEFKIAAESWIRRTLSPDRYAIVRPAAVWGVGDPTLTPRIVSFLRRSPWIVHFGKWRGQNRWPLAHVRNLAAAIFLAATSPETAGRAINVLDGETTSIDAFYRLVASVFLPHKRWRSITLPFWTGRLLGGLVSTLSNALHLDRPLLDPSLYALYSVSHNLDFSNRRFRDLMSRTGRQIVSRDEGMAELRASVEREKALLAAKP